MKTSRALLLSFSLGLLLAQAEEPATKDKSRPEFLQQFDSNEDGIIDEEERQAIRDLREVMVLEQRNTIDLDQDGRISPEEIQSARNALRQSIEARRLDKFTAIAGDDGLISEEEYSQIPGANRLPAYVLTAIFNRLDADADGVISAEEFLRRLRKHQASR